MTLSPVRQPVRRHKAANYVLILITSFCAAVTLTRLFLTLTGFPQIGNSELHIAHVLWGGLFLFIASLLLLTLSNSWVYTLGAILSGIGVGLFIDEVGKFITQSNDYFYPLAIPIIYGVILVTILIYLQVRRPQSTDSRAELYRALETLQELLDHDLDVNERAELDARLNRIATNPAATDVNRLAQVLHEFINGSSIQLAPEKNDFFTRSVRSFKVFAANRVGRRTLKYFIVLGLFVIGLTAVAELFLLALAIGSRDYLAELTQYLIHSGQVRGLASLNWFIVRLAIEGSVGSLLMIASVLWLLGHEQRGQEIGYGALLFSLTVVNLVVFYFDQFGNIVLTLVEVSLLFSLILYRLRYLVK